MATPQTDKQVLAVEDIRQLRVLAAADRLRWTIDDAYLHHKDRSAWHADHDALNLLLKRAQR